MNDESIQWATRGRRSRCSPHAALAATIALALALGAWWVVSRGDDGFGGLFARDDLGPGVGAWYSSFPEERGLSGSTLTESVAGIRRTLPARDCAVVTRDGAVVHEEYYNGATMNSAFDLGRLGKVASALVVGAAIQRHDLDLDDAVKGYMDVGERFAGDTPPGWNAEWWRSLTVRQLLAQVDAKGQSKPGTVFSDDAGANDHEHSSLRYLNAVLRGATGKSPVDFAEEFLAKPLGLENFFAQQKNKKGDISFVGGQLASCRDIVRFGQLIVNEGKWKSTDGSVHQLVDPHFIREMMKPSFPQATKWFGLTGWVYNAETSTNNSEVSREELFDGTSVSGLGSDCPVVEGPVLPGDEPKYDVLFNVGELGSMMISIPSKKTVVVSLGTTWASSPACPAAAKVVEQANLPESERDVLPRNDLFAVQKAWQYVKLAVEPDVTRELTHKRGGLAASRKPSYESLWESLHHKREGPSSVGNINIRLSRLGQVDDSARNEEMEGLVNSIPQSEIDASRASTAAAQTNPTWTEDDTERYSGSCSCSCAPNLHIGQCFNVRNSRSQNCDDLSLRARGAAFCPELGIVNSCDDPNAVAVSQYGTTSKYAEQNISSMLKGDHGMLTLTNKQINPFIQDKSDLSQSVFTCKVEQGCGDDAASAKWWSTKDGRYGDNMYALKCAPTGFSVCTFKPNVECDFDNVKMPLVNVSVVEGDVEATVEMPTEGWILQQESAASEGGDLGEDVTYYRLHTPGRREEHVQLQTENNEKYFAINAFIGAGAIAFGVVLVALAKGSLTGVRELDGSERLVNGDSKKYTDSV